MMAAPKTRQNNASVSDFLSSIEDPQRRQDARTVMALMQKITGERPRMWGTSIIGYGSYRYRYASGQEGDWPLTGLSPRKQALTLYIMSGFQGSESLMKKLGKYRTGKACLYVKRLEDVDLETLEQLIAKSVRHKRSGG